MATLSFKGKSFVQNYHLAVKYHELIPVKKNSLTDKVSLKDNLIIHGDNLKALKALLPTYAGKIKCIYIDPPYNTGNEKWVYNDNVNSPMMQEWLGKVVDKEDLTRHDKWLCMMMPRLKLLRELLSEDGTIYVSVDDNEQHRMRMLMDEIYGENNFIASIVWEKADSPRMDVDYFSSRHDYVLGYAKSIESVGFHRLINSGMVPAHYNRKDEVGKAYYLKPLRAMGGQGETRKARPNLYYELTAPDGTSVFPKLQNGQDGAWRWSKKKVEAEKERIEWVKKANSWTPYFRIYADDSAGRPPETIFTHADVGSSRTSKAELKSLFPFEMPFDTPKPVKLIKKLLTISADQEAVVLDSFAGSGTTAHAVLDLNREDGGKRKFILVECEDYADEITAERLKRVIKGVSGAKDHTLRNGLGGSFSFFELGEPIELESILEGSRLPSYMDLARYVFYTATGEEFLPEQVDEDKHFIGESKDYEVYLFYKPDLDYLKSTALTLEVAKALGDHTGKKKLVFAPTKYLDLNDSDLLARHGLEGIEYCQLPFEIYKLRE
jgi:adenine-specific DNA-methyltransferase